MSLHSYQVCFEAHNVIFKARVHLNPFTWGCLDDQHPSFLYLYFLTYFLIFMLTLDYAYQWWCMLTGIYHFYKARELVESYIMNTRAHCRVHKHWDSNAHASTSNRNMNCKPRKHAHWFWTCQVKTQGYPPNSLVVFDFSHWM